MSTPTPRTDAAWFKYLSSDFGDENINEFRSLSYNLESELSDMTRQRNGLQVALTKALETIVKMTYKPN